MSIPLEKRRFTVAEYYRMAEAGILSEDERIELLEGEIVEMTPIGSRHAACVISLTRLFSHEAGERALVSVQNPVRLSHYSEPQPDLMLLRPRQDHYAAAHPQPQDVLLIVEVAHTSLEIDHRVKIPLYAASGIREVWLVNLEEDVVQTFQEPTADGYRETRPYRRGELLAPAALPEIEIAVADIIPGRT